MTLQEKYKKLHILYIILVIYIIKYKIEYFIKHSFFYSNTNQQTRAVDKVSERVNVAPKCSLNFH